MSTQDQRTPSTGAWKIVEYPDKPRNVHIPRNNYRTAVNLPVSRHPPSDQQRQFSVCEGDVWIHVYDMFIRASDDRGLLFMHFSEDTRFKILDTMVKMLVPDNSVQEDSLPDDVLVPMQPYKDTESGENVTVITTLPFNSMDGQLTVFVAPFDSDGWVDVTQTRACLKTLLTPALDGPDVKTMRALQDIISFFLQGLSPSAVVMPTTGERQDRVPRDLQYENTNHADGTALEHEGHLSQRGQTLDEASGSSLCVGVTDMIPARVLQHFKKTKSKLGIHIKTCRLCRENVSPLLHTAICRKNFCQRCIAVALMIAWHMGRCVDPLCPLSKDICANDICIPVFVPGRFEPTVAFVSLVRSVLARLLRFDA